MHQIDKTLLKLPNQNFHFPIPPFASFFWRVIYILKTSLYIQERLFSNVLVLVTFYIWGAQLGMAFDVFWKQVMQDARERYFLCNVLKWIEIHFSCWYNIFWFCLIGERATEINTMN